MKETGIFGGSFNPVHIAHLILAEHAAESAGLDQVLFVPALVPPHKPHETLAAAGQRLEMLELALAGNPIFKICTAEIERAGPSYTLTTVRQLQKNTADARFHLILGADSVRDLPDWHRAAELVRNVEIIGLRRPGVKTDMSKSHEETLGAEGAQKLKDCFLPVPEIDISSSDIRARVRERRSIRYLVPDDVREYIRGKGLYR